MRGYDWRTVGRTDFERIVDTLLGREFGERGHAVDGRGGDAGIDYDVDEGRVIYQYKYFPDGFPSSTRTRRRQIQDSFRVAMAQEPEEWVLVVPANLTPPERAFVLGLAVDSKVRTRILDRAELDLLLAKYRDVAQYFMFTNDSEYLFEKASAFKLNPIIRNTRDIQQRLTSLQEAIEDVDPDWTVDLSVKDGVATQTIRPKDANSSARSPISVSFQTSALLGEAERKSLENGLGYGFIEPLSLPREMVSYFEISGPPLLARTSDTLERLEFLPGEPLFDWRPCDVALLGADREILETHLGEARQIARGRSGSTLEIRVGRQVTIVLRMPWESGSGTASITIESLEGAPVSEVAQTCSFLAGARRSHHTRFVIDSMGGFTTGSLGAISNEDFFDQYQDAALLADDLRVVEAESRLRFRFPSDLPILERLAIRNLRLMYEGKAVADPTTRVSITPTLEGPKAADIDDMLSFGLWVGQIADNVEVSVLGQTLTVPAIRYLALVRAAPDEVTRIQAAFTAGNAAGQSFRLDMRENDAVRVFMPDRMPPDQPIEITPWGVRGVRQLGLTSEGLAIT